MRKTHLLLTLNAKLFKVLLSKTQSQRREKAKNNMTKR